MRQHSTPRHPNDSPYRALSLRLGLIGFLLLGLAACSVLRQQLPTPTPAPQIILQVTADQIARAMQEDHFYSDYETYTLRVQGTVSGLTQQGSGLTIELNTTVGTGVYCEMRGSAPDLRPCEAITVTAPGNEAQRSPGAVLLKHCALTGQK